jgi:hypothetical protein
MWQKPKNQPFVEQVPYNLLHIGILLYFDSDFIVI